MRVLVPYYPPMRPIRLTDDTPIFWYSYATVPKGFPCSVHGHVIHKRTHQIKIPHWITDIDGSKDRFFDTPCYTMIVQ
ncbi:hypothetical protein LCGC14_2861390 [marine sediment metagenome]|uniref:Uncharacterized protein n=1 Tax=marine sediment metagenome TaxID=412755 RepID=A0A0F8YS93_9ZZZZ